MQSIKNFYTKYFKPGIVSIDSRKVKPGNLFFALKGPNFNGNLFINNALDAGASIAVTDQKIQKTDDRIIKVNNVYEFLKNLALYHRKSSDFHVIGLTGSNGKTTTKELIQKVLSTKFSCYSTQGNLNNHIGVPLTLLSIPTHADLAVIEMGANHLGEIKELCNIALPQSGLITNIGRAHLEGFGNFEGVIKAKSELFNHLKSRDGKIYCNKANQILDNLITETDNAVYYNDTTGICHGKILHTIPNLKIELSQKNRKTVSVSSQLFGDYNFENILAAAAIGLDLGIDLENIKYSIEHYKPSNNRSQIQQIGSTRIILDCYNANPSSMELALRNFGRFKAAHKTVVLGEMNELGDYSEIEHRKLGALVEELDFDQVFLVGEKFTGIHIKKAIHLESIMDIKGHLQTSTEHDSAILIKGSRSNSLERITDFLQETNNI